MTVHEELDTFGGKGEGPPRSVEIYDRRPSGLAADVLAHFEKRAAETEAVPTRYEPDCSVCPCGEYWEEPGEPGAWLCKLSDGFIPEFDAPTPAGNTDSAYGRTPLGEKIGHSPRPSGLAADPLVYHGVRGRLCPLCGFALQNWQGICLACLRGENEKARGLPIEFGGPDYEPTAMVDSQDSAEGLGV